MCATGNASALGRVNATRQLRRVPAFRSTLVRRPTNRRPANTCSAPASAACWLSRDCPSVLTLAYPTIIARIHSALEICRGRDQDRSAKARSATARTATARSGREIEAASEKLKPLASMSFGVLEALPKARRTVGDTVTSTGRRGTGGGPWGCARRARCSSNRSRFGT
jgi:hypothetical protein